MRYRKLEKSGIELSVLGFGALRLPVIDDVQENINEELALEMIHYAIDNGINFIDTGYNYHDGKSEVVVGKALKNGYREKVFLSTKLPCFWAETENDFDRFLDEQFKRLQVDYLDFYLLHGLNSFIWEKMKAFNLLDWCEKKRAEGKFKYLGFSLHDSFGVFKDVLDAYDWDICLVQHNYMNEDVQVGNKGVEYCGAKKIPLLIMEPLLGGGLANFPAHIQEIWDKSKQDPVDMAFKWLWDKPQITSVLSGMSTLDQVRQNIESASKSSVNSMTTQELDLVDKVKNEYNKLKKIQCTKCRYCVSDCPMGIDIPTIIQLYNESHIYEGNVFHMDKIIYNGTLLPEDKRADACIQCRKCEKHCPQSIPISELMPVMHEALYEEPEEK